MLQHYVSSSKIDQNHAPDPMGWDTQGMQYLVGHPLKDVFRSVFVSVVLLLLAFVKSDGFLTKLKIRKR